MAALGSLSLECNGALLSGLAQLLVKPPRAKHEFNHEGATFRVSPECPFIICCFSEATSHAEVIVKGAELLQEGLDVLSMTGADDLATRDAADEYFAWWRDAGKKMVVATSTATLSFLVGPVKIEVRDASGNLVAPKIVAPQHHLAFRFYRLAQVSDDLFDAYRNMYLAFELLLSARYPKRKEREIDWLRKSLTAAANDLRLSNLGLVGHPVAVENVIDTLYTNARLPLFHAKDGRAYFAPSIANADRKVVSRSLDLLTRIVIRMAESWHHTRRIGGAVNLNLMEKNYEKLFEKAQFVASTGSVFSPNDDLSNPHIREGIRFDAKLTDQFDGEYRPHVQGSLSIAPRMGEGTFGAVYIVNDEAPLMPHTFEAALDVRGFDVFEAYCFLRQINASEPRTLFAR